MYLALDTAIAAWRRASGLGCPLGCGICCAGYEPSVLPLEGLAVAAYVACARPAAAAILDAPRPGESVGCILADPNSPLHCTVYPARPLECRLFGFSGQRDKNGSPLFRLCRHMEGPEPRTMGSAELEARYGAIPPLMSDYGTHLEALTAGPSAPLREQARAAWATFSWFRDPGLPRAV